MAPERDGEGQREGDGEGQGPGGVSAAPAEAGQEGFEGEGADHRVHDGVADADDPVEEASGPVAAAAEGGAGDDEGGGAGAHAAEAGRADGEEGEASDHDDGGGLPEGEPEGDGEGAVDDVGEGEVGAEPEPEDVLGAAVPFGVGYGVDPVFLDLEHLVAARGPRGPGGHGRRLVSEHTALLS